MYIDRIPNRNSPPAVLVRESYREDGKVKKRTVANLTGLPEDCIAAVAAVLEGHALVPAGVGFETTRTTPHGHVNALLTTLRRIGLDDMIASKPCRERSIIMALIVARILHGSSKLASTRLWQTTTLAEELELAGGRRQRGLRRHGLAGGAPIPDREQARRTASSVVFQQYLDT